MNAQSTDRETVREPGILIWQGTPSDHSGAYHVILTVGLDGVPVEIAIENPDCCRLEIPGLLDSGWDPQPEKVVAEFFELAETCRPKKGVYVDQERVNTVEELAEQLGFLSPELKAFFNEPSAVPSSIDTNDSLLIYSRIENRTESDLYEYFSDPQEDDMMEKLGERFSMIRQFMTSGSDPDGFIQLITSEDWMRIDEFSGIFSWWLWESPDRLIRRISDG
jgi:hypothetical protein